MKRILWIMLIVLAATPLLAQDDGGAFFADEGGFGGDGGFFGGGDAGGGRGNQQVDRLADVRRWLTQAKAMPLAKDQEKPLTTLLDNEVKAMTSAFQTRFGHAPGANADVPAAGRGQAGGRGSAGGPAQPQGQPQVQPQRGQGPGAEAGGGQGQGRGARGQARGGGGFNRVPPAEAAELRRMNEALAAKLIAALKPEQQADLKKWQSDQIRTLRLNAFKASMDTAGASLTPEQIPQVEALYTEESQARAQLLTASPGTPDPASVARLETQTMTKVVRLLNAAQRKALVDSMTKAKPQ